MAPNRRNAAKVYRWCTVGIVVGTFQIFGGLLVGAMTTHGDNSPAWFWPWLWISVGSSAVLVVICSITGKMIGKGRYDW
jgi:hypothetical protein